MPCILKLRVAPKGKDCSSKELSGRRRADREVWSGTHDIQPVEVSCSLDMQQCRRATA